MNVIVDGLMTNYVKVGSGKKVLICIHGWGDNLSGLASLIDELSKNYTVLALDLPGFGGTEEPPKPWGVDDYARFTFNWLKKIGVKKIDVLLGHSNGGAIAISLVGNKTLSPAKLILVSSSGIRDIYKMRRLVLKSSAKAVKLPMQLLPKKTRERVRSKVYGAIGSDYMLIPELWPSYQLIIRQDMQSTATKIKCPTLLIYGDKDKTTPVKYGQLFNDAIKDSQLKVIEGGHLIPRYKAGDIAEMVGKFVGA